MVRTVGLGSRIKIVPIPVAIHSGASKKVMASVARLKTAFARFSSVCAITMAQRCVAVTARLTTTSV